MRSPSIVIKAFVALVTIVLGSLGGCTSGSGDFDGSTCATGQTSCQGTCTSTQTDPNNCGACGTACKSGEVCSQGACATSCGGGTTKCGMTCNDLKNDPQNCGTCGMACPMGEFCSAGKCTSSCGGGTTACGMSCVDTKVDPSNCGMCGMKCTSGQVCSGGTCASDCGSATLCSPDGGAPYCAETQTDNANCGTCGHACGAGQVCSGGACGSSCGGSDGGTETFCTPDAGSPYCADTQNDAKNCNTCGNVCGLGLGCAGGTCQVINGQSEIAITKSMMVGTAYTACSLSEFTGGSVSGTCPTLAGFMWTDAANQTPSSMSITVDASWDCAAAGTRAVMLNGTNVGTIASGAGCTCTPGTNVRSMTLTSVAPFVKGGTNTITFAAGSTTACDSFQANAAWSNLFGFVNLTY